MMPPPTPLQRPHPLKRDSSYIDTDDENGLSLNTKKLRVTPDEIAKPLAGSRTSSASKIGYSKFSSIKQQHDISANTKKVAFNDEIAYKSPEKGWDDKSIELVREEVKSGIDRHLAPAHVRDDTQYNKLLHMLRQAPSSEDAASSQMLIKYLTALESRTSMLGECGKLVMATLDQEWLGRDEVFVAMYIRFIVSLASSHARYLQPVMEKLVSHFANLPARSGRLPGEEVVSRPAMFSRLHLAIKSLLKHIPAASTVLVRVLKLEFPGDFATSRKHSQYQLHLLEIGEYAYEIKAEIIAIIVQRMVSLDVDIQAEIVKMEDEEDDEAEDNLLQNLFQPESDDVDSDRSDYDSESSSDESIAEDEMRYKDLRLKIAKIDRTMDLLFNYYNPIIKDGTPADSNEAYDQLLSHFTTFIMPSRTRHAQFLLFHFSQTSPEHVTIFAEQCIQQGFGQLATTQRYRAIAYLASFIARGTHVQRDIVQSTFLVLCDYLEQMRQRYEPACRGPDRRAYALYYAVAQALLYIFCFRWRDLVVREEDDDMNADDILEDVGELQWLPGIKESIRKSVFGQLNILKVCAPQIVEEFADIARHVRFMEVLSKIESNKRLRLATVYPRYESPSKIDIARRETAIDRKVGDSHHQLESYFPFDPYFLPNSKQWVAGDYNEWKPPRGLNRDDEDDDEVEGEYAETTYEDDESDEDIEADLANDDENGVSMFHNTAVSGPVPVKC